MADPGYDFFATASPVATPPPGAPAPAVPEPTVAAAASGPVRVNQFGLPVDDAAVGVPTGPYAAPGIGAAPVATPGMVTTWDVTAPVTPGPATNQFGTPVGESAVPVPTGPYAAPGIGAAPVAAPGLVTTWDAAASASVEPTVAPVASRFGTPPDAPVASRFGTPPDAPVARATVEAPPTPAAPVYAAPTVNHFGTPLDVEGAAAPVASWSEVTATAPIAGAVGHRHAAAGPVLHDARPGAVTAAGVIAIVVGAGYLLFGVLGLLGWMALRSQIADLQDQLSASGQGMPGASDLVGVVSAAILVGALVFLAVGVLYVGSGVATIRGRRWAAWVLIGVSAVNVLWGLYRMVSDGGPSGAYGFGTVVGLGISVSVVVLLMLEGSQRWLRSR